MRKRATNEESWYDEDKSRVFPELIQKLMEILTTEAYSDIVCWLPHGKGFIFRDRKRFAAEIMPLYFSTPTFISFRTKLKRWHFKRVTKGPEKGAFYHPKVQNPNMPAKKKAKKSNTHHSEDMVDAATNQQQRDASNHAGIAEEEDPKPTFDDDDFETDDDGNDDDESMNSEDKEFPDSATLNPSRSRRIAIAYLFLHVYDFPPKSEWPNVARLIKKALHIPLGTKIDYVFNEIVRCKEKRIEYTGRNSTENDQMGRPLKIKLDSEEAQIIAKCIQDGMSLQATKDFLDEHCLRAGIEPHTSAAIYTCVKKLGVNSKKYGSKRKK